MDFFIITVSFFAIYAIIYICIKKWQNSKEKRASLQNKEFVKGFLTQCVNDFSDAQLVEKISKMVCFFRLDTSKSRAAKYAMVVSCAEAVARNGGNALTLVNNNAFLLNYFFVGINKYHDDLSIQKMIFGVKLIHNNRYVLRYQLLAEKFLVRWDLHPEVKKMMRIAPELLPIWLEYEQHRNIKTGKLWA